MVPNMIKQLLTSRVAHEFKAVRIQGQLQQGSASKRWYFLQQQKGRPDAAFLKAGCQKIAGHRFKISSFLLEDLHHARTGISGNVSLEDSESN